MITLKFNKDVELFGTLNKKDTTLDLESNGLLGNYYTGEVSRLIRKGDITPIFDENMPIVQVRLNPEIDYAYVDFSIMGFTKETPTRVRGRKTKAEYLYEGKLAVRKTFHDVMDGLNLVGINCLFEFFNFKGELTDSKLELVVSFSKDAAEEHMKNRRERQFAFMRSGVRGTDKEPYIDILFDYFKTEIDRYKESGNVSFATKMDETLAIDLSTLPTPEAQKAIGTIQAILVTEVDRIDDPTKKIKVIDSIKYQMGLYELED